MFRYSYNTHAGNRFRFTASGEERDAQTHIFSQLGYGRRFRNTTSLQGTDQEDGQRFSADYEFAWGGWEQGLARAFVTRSTVEQLTREERGAQVPPVALRRYFEFHQDRSGIDINLFHQVNWDGALHRIGLGVEWLRSDSSELRDGLQTNTDDGSTTNVILGEAFPLRDFPNSRSDELGVFIQDEIEFDGGRWKLIPALRWDRYDLDPRVDDIWLEDFPDTEVVGVSEDQITPRLGALFHGPRDWTVYGKYSRGFRAPPFEDANIGLNVALFGYRAIPNPDLRSETSDGYEIGVRRIDSDSSLSLAFFHIEYDDFIETRALVGVDPETGDLLFQSRNIDRARIRGFDLRYDQDIGAWFERLRGWRLHAAAFWTEGENRQSGLPLNSISPPQAVAGLSWTSGDGIWDFGITAVVTAPKRESDIDSQSGARFAVPGWGRVDLTAGWRAREWLEIRAGVFNLGDNTYWRWLDVSRLEADDPLIPVLSRPGRNVSLSARIHF
jgi:hemoglobin/transferrin/lactoferrin receptor protein